MLEFRNIYAGYGKIPIVQDVSVQVRKGIITSILGPNGSGKSTLFKTIFGLSKVFSGSILFESIDITHLSNYKVAKLGVSYVPQVDNVFPNLTVKENLEMGAQDPRSVKENLQHVYNLFPILKERSSMKAAKLSGGERQMLAIGRALMTKPKLLILDEPSVALSPKLSETLYQRIIELNKNGVSIALIDQNVRKALQVSEDTMVLLSGKVVYQGSSSGINEEIWSKLILGKK
ncbi:MAG: ABC transporter ATP-binding protein [Nitrososphaerales archaeon]